jgi:YbbR domain-containing protein
MLQPPRNWRKLIVDNVFWFLGCVALAFLLWMVAILQSDPISEWRLTERVPIRVEPDDGLLIVNSDSLTSSATVYLRGPTSERPLITADDVVVTARLAGLGQGTHVVPLSSSVVGGVRVANISPSQLTITLEQEAALFVPVREQIDAAPPPDIELVDVTFDVLQAEIRGAQGQVQQVVAAQVPLDLSRERATFETDVRLQPVDVDGEIVTGVSIVPGTVRATVALEQSESVLELDVRPQLVGELPEGFFLSAIEFSPQTVYVSLPSPATGELSSTVFTEPIDLSDRTSDFTIDVPIELMLDGAVPISEPNITVTIGISAQMATRQFDNVPVELIGRRQGLVYTPDSSTVSVIVSGPQPVLNTLTTASLRITADVIAFQAVGSYRVTLEAQIADNDEGITASILPSEILVQVSTPTPEATPDADANGP